MENDKYEQEHMKNHSSEQELIWKITVLKSQTLKRTILNRKTLMERTYLKKDISAKETCKKGYY